MSDNNSKKYSSTIEEFIKKSIKIHDYRYDYSLVKYKNAFVKINIICKKCNFVFSQKPNAHLNGTGCPKCAKASISKPEIKWLNELNIKEEYRQYSIKINNKTYKVDGYNPETNTIYEFFGDYWHGNPNKYKPEDINIKNKKSFGQLYRETMDRIKLFQDNGYNVVYKWENNKIK